MTILRVALLSCAFALLMGSPAFAKFEVCNHTQGEVEVAIAYETDQDVYSKGWWKLTPEQCEVVLTMPLNRPYYYHYVVAKSQHLQWGGTYNFCTSVDPMFQIQGTQDCEGRDFTTTGFRQTDTKGSPDYTLHIRTAPAPAPSAR